MSGLTWTASVWAIALVLTTPGGWRAFLKSGRFHLSRAQWAIVLVLLGAHSFAGRSPAEEILADPVVLARVVRGALAGTALLLASPALLRNLKSRRVGRTPALTAFTVYALIAALSTLYSIAPVVTIGKSLELAAALTAIWVIATGPNPREEFLSTLRLLIVLEAALLTVAVIGYFVMPGVFHSADQRPGFITAQSMGSPYGHSNGLSASGALIFAYALASFFKTADRRIRLGWMALAGIGTLAMLLASGRQGLIIWAAAAAVILWFHSRRALVVFIGPATAAIVAANWGALWGVVTRDQAAVNLATWSGRLIWWKAALAVGRHHIWTGFGYGAGGRWAALETIGRASASSLHNGYLEAYLGVGLIGLIPLTIVIVRVLAWSARELRARALTPLGILIVPLLLHTSVSLGFGGWVTGDLIMFVCLAGLADASRRTTSSPTTAPSQPPITSRF